MGTTKNASLVTLCVLLAGCGDGEQAAPDVQNEHVGSAQQAMNYTQEWALPVPVGLNPLDLVLGAEKININDRAKVYGNIAALGTTEMSHIGNRSQVGNVWVRSDVLIRGATIGGFVKASGAITVQPTTTYGDPEENRDHITIQPDSIFTVTIATSDTGPNVTGNTSIGPGTYGSVIVQPNQQLTLTAPGVYKFASLDLEPYSKLNLPAGLTQINVHSNMILRSPLGTATKGLVVKYAGTNSVQVDSQFTGDLFIAPNATIEFKHSATGSFFAKRIEVHQDLQVTRRPLWEGPWTCSCPPPLFVSLAKWFPHPPTMLKSHPRS